MTEINVDRKQCRMRKARGQKNSLGGRVFKSSSKRKRKRSSRKGVGFIVCVCLNVFVWPNIGHTILWVQSNQHASGSPKFKLRGDDLGENKRQ